MFPLSTPAHSGLLIDWLSLAIVLVGICAFVAGLDDVVNRRGRSGEDRIDIFTLGAYGALALVGLAVAVMLAGLRGIPVAQGTFLLIAAWGVIRTVMRASHHIRHSAFDIPRSTFDVRTWRALAFAGAAGCSLWFWTAAFEDHVALPSAHDGIVHTAYYLRLLQAGVPTLGRVPIGFGNVFGAQLFEFYPTGTHALIAITSGFWGEWGVISQAGILKAWLTLAMAAAPWALLWFVWRLMPRMPWWVGLALVFVAIPGCRFPVEAAHEGGTSRIIAHVVMAPIYADILLGRFGTWRSTPLAGVVLALAFLMHPSAFVTLAALLTYAAMWSRGADASWRPRVARIARVACALAVGAGVAVILLRWNGGAALARDAAKSFSWAALLSRLQGGWLALFHEDYVVAATPWLILTGLGLLVASRETFGVPWRLALFPLWMVLITAIALSAQVISLPGFRLIGGAFYDETPRVIELLYEPAGLCFAALAWFACAVASAGASRLRWLGRRAWPGFVLPAILVVAAVTYEQGRRPWIHEHIAFWDRQVRTPRISRLRTLGAWLETNAEPDAIVFHPAFDAEIWEAWTGRRGIFMYGECQPHGSRLQKPKRACEERKQLVGDRLDNLVWALDHPDPASRCLAEIDRFRRPGYFLLPSSFTSSEPWRVCSDATYVATLDGRAVFAYRRP